MMANVSMDKTVREQLECPVCMDQFNMPKLLSCMHTFCQDCLKPLMKKKHARSTIVCPQCRQKTVVSDVANLHTNFIAQNVIEALTNAKKEEKSVQQNTECNKKNTSPCFGLKTEFHFDGVANDKKNVSNMSSFSGFVSNTLPDWNINAIQLSQNDASVSLVSSEHNVNSFANSTVELTVFSSVVNTSSLFTLASTSCATSVSDSRTNPTFNCTVPAHINFCANVTPNFTSPAPKASVCVSKSPRRDILMQDKNKSKLFTIGWNKKTQELNTIENVCESFSNLSISADNTLNRVLNPVQLAIGSISESNNENIETKSSKSLDVPSWGSIHSTSFAP